MGCGYRAMRYRKLAAPDTIRRQTYHCGMTTYFVSRHPGGIEWAAQQNLHVDAFVAHLDPTQVQPGDTVIGNLPVHLAAQVCERGGVYWHLSLALPAELRGRELSAADMARLGAHVKPYTVESATTTGHNLS